jgi:succinoglycan biosynthesis protein ExoA
MTMPIGRREEGAVPPAPAAGRPTVSVVLPIRNEVAHIEAVLEQLLEQDYPRHLIIEIIVVDGRSEDGTRDAIARFQERHPDARIRVLDNPRRITSAALNIGIVAARGDVVVRMDGHAVPATDYVSRCVDTLQRSGAANVGGVVEPVGQTSFGAAVALATRHPLGAGDARYRVGGAAADVDTVMYGAFRRDVFEKVGLFDESMVVNEDYELNVRIRSAGYRIHFDPSIRFQYTPRGTVRDLWRQYFRYGWWKVETLRRVPTSLRWRQALPPALPAALILLSLASPWSMAAAAALIAIIATYTLATVAVAWRVAKPPASIAHVWIAFAVLHMAWGLGFLVNVVTLGRFPYQAEPPLVPGLPAMADRGSEPARRR